MLITVCAHNIVKIKQTIVLLDMTISYNVVLSSTTIFLFTPNHLTTMVKLSYVIHKIFTNLGSMVYCDDPTMLQKFESLAMSWLWTFNLWTGKMQIWILYDYSAAPRGHWNDVINREFFYAKFSTFQSRFTPRRKHFNFRRDHLDRKSRL